MNHTISVQNENIIHLMFICYQQQIKYHFTALCMYRFFTHF